MRVIKVMADYSASPLWKLDAGMDSGNVSPASLGISDGLAVELESWADEYDKTLNIDDPRLSGFPSREAELAFVAKGQELAERVASELGPRTKVIFQHDVAYRDPSRR